MSPLYQVARNSLLLTLPISLALLQGCETFAWKDNGNAKTKSIAEISQAVRQQAATVSKPLPQVSIPETQVIQSPAPVVEEPQPATVWERLLAGYSLDKPLNKRVQTEYDWFSSHPEYLQRVQQRAEPFMHFILNEVEKRNMPTEMALLPVVESAFQPFAYSHGRAAGLWQFIPSTGRAYGLKQNWWYDGRRDVIASTAAALDYLQALHKQLGGDWEYALAAYNAGAGNVRKAIRHNKRKKRPVDFWSLGLPKETQAYVPRLIAISMVFRDAEKLGISLDSIPDEPRIAVVPIKSQIDLAKAAEMADISVEELYNLNPAYNRWATDPAGPHRLVLPIESEAVFSQRMAELDESDLLQWQRYKIKNGDSLIRIANKHKTTVAIIKDVNNLKSHRIRAGKYLLIPVSSASPEVYSKTVSQRLAQKQSVKRSGTKIEYTVQPGDNLWDISRTYKVSYKKIAKWNGMAPTDTLRTGQTLVIWTKQKSSNTTLAVNDVPKRISKVSYTIRKGDSLSRIANKFNVSVADIKKWNTINKKYLQPGDRLKLNVDVTEQL